MYGGEIIKRKIYIVLIIMLTFITTYIITLFHPDKDNILAKEKYYQLSSFLAGKNDRNLDSYQDKSIVNDEVLDRFIKFYSNKSIEELEIYEKEEVRYLLESMGNYNSRKLTKLLQDELIIKEEEIYQLLNENLFDEDLMLLNEILN